MASNIVDEYVRCKNLQGTIEEKVLHASDGMLHYSGRFGKENELIPHSLESTIDFLIWFHESGYLTTALTSDDKYVRSVAKGFMQLKDRLNF